MTKSHHKFNYKYIEDGKECLYSYIYAKKEREDKCRF